MPDAVHQIDHWHVAARIWEACDADLRRFDRLRRRGFDDPRRLARDIRTGRVTVNPRVADELAGYLEHVAADLHGWRRLPAGLRRGRMRIVSSACVEKHQDLLVKRRMKRQGMRWTRTGADRLLALQALRHSGGWSDHWHPAAA